MKLLLVIYAFMGVSQSVLTIVLLLKFRKARKSLDVTILKKVETENYPGISILVPVKGLLHSFEKNFRSLLEQDYPGPLELLLAVRDANDPVIPVAQRSIDQSHSSTKARIVVGGPDHGYNPKNLNLARAFALAQHPWIYCSDSDLKLDPLHLRRCIRTVNSDPMTYATTMTLNIGPRNLGAKLEAIGSNLEVPIYFLISALSPKMDAMNGGSMFFHRDLLLKAGGFQRVVNTLTDDLVFGRAFVEAGGRGKLVQALVTENLDSQKFSQYRARMVRWILIVRCFRPEMFWVAPFTWYWQWLLLVAISTQSVTALVLSACVILSRLIASLVSQISQGAPRDDWRKIWVLPIYDFMAPFSWLQSCFERRVVWNGNELQVQRNGQLKRVST